MTATCLKLIDAAGPTIVEGPFARNAEFIAMLKAVTARPVVTSEAVTGTSIGAALLFSKDQALPATSEQAAADAIGDLAAYAEHWISSVE